MLYEVITVFLEAGVNTFESIFGQVADLPVEPALPRHDVDGGSPLDGADMQAGMGHVEGRVLPSFCLQIRHDRLYAGDQLGRHMDSRDPLVNLAAVGFLPGDLVV